MADPSPSDLLPGLRRALVGEVALHETHASWVLVGAREALKVKKPVVLPFLDYGSLERRRAACRAEVELNRRLAPDVYLGATAIVRGDGGAELAPEGDPRAVEYAVRMRRYADSDTVAERLRRDAVTPEHVERLGALLAEFHGSAPADTRTDGAEPVKRWLDDTLASLYALASRSRDRKLVARVERFAAGFAAARWDELDARARAGRVRDGHGDLRADHVLLEEDRILVVDCIEFDPALRRIDVGSDLAFLVMDLHGAGRPDLASRLLAAYRGAGGDPGDDALVAWFASYRALVRAKVALRRAAQQPDLEADRSRAAAARLLAIAERLTWRARGPLTIVVAGLAASGKTTLATALAERAGLPRVSSDVVRKAAAGLAPTDRGAPALYAPEVNATVYATLGRRAAAAADGAVIDATFRARSERDAFRAAHGDGRRLLYVECVAPPSVREARAAARSHDPGRVSDADATVVRGQVMDPLDEVRPGDHVVVRGDAEPATQVDAIADAIDRSPGSLQEPQGRRPEH